MVVTIGACCAGLRADVPAAARARDAMRLMHDRAGEAVRQLDRLHAALVEATDAGRAGAGRTVAGKDPPGPRFEEAAVVLERAESGVGEVRRAVDRLRGAMQLAEVGALIEQPVDAGELSSIASQLRSTAAAADAFAEMRRRTERIPTTLDEALTALSGDDLDEAERLVGDARTDHDAVSAWEVDLVTLPIWLETTDALIADVATIVHATRVGDRASAEAAAQSFAARADEATTADRALRIAIGEGGSAVTGTPLVRLADLLARVASARVVAQGLGS